MVDCSDEQIRQKLDRVLQAGANALGQSQMDSLLGAFETLAARHLRAVPSSARRLAVRLGAMHVTSLVAHEARMTAMHVCEANQECNRDMEINVQLHPSGYLGGPLQMLTLGLGVAIGVLLLIVATLACVLRRIVISLMRNLPSTTSEGAKVAVAELAAKTEVAEVAGKAEVAEVAAKADVAEQV